MHHQTHQTYSDTPFTDLLSQCATQIGKKIVTMALALWNLLHDPECPVEAKAVIVAALAYLVLPVDAIPDFIAGFGWADDWAALCTAAKAVADHLMPKHWDEAKKQWEDWFSSPS